jgi:hypothetical protein
MSIFSNQKTQKKLIDYFCEKCDFHTCNKNDYNRHLLTKKHFSNICQSNMVQKTQKTQKNSFACDCGKTYKDNSGLWRHKKKCTETEPLVSTNETDEKTLIMMLIKQNTELLEIVKNGTHNTTNNTNFHNKTFNLNMFLNETCKDAMNINDFVDSLQLQLSDLEKVGELGYIEGISSIIVKNLNAMDVTLRPVHCTDKKRETMYIKDEDKWEKEDANKVKLHKMVRKVANKNIHLIQDFKEKYPDCIRSTSRHSDKYNKIIVESMGGTGDNEYEKEEKIIKKIAKEVLIEK